MSAILRLVLSACVMTMGAASLLPGVPARAEPRVIVYPRPVDADRWDYALRLIQLALERTGRTYTLRPTAGVLTQARAAQELKAGAIDLIWAGTSRDYEATFRPIRIPLLRGLEGYRICIINRRVQPVFTAAATLADLTRLSIGQGAGWSDVAILEASGFSVTVAAYESLFAMAERRRFDCFLRGIHEAPREVEARRAAYPELALEEDGLVVYPFASFFFVSRDDAVLADDLDRGLRLAYEDGSFLRLFRSHPAVSDMRRVVCEHVRRRFDIPNPLLTEETRRIDPRFWQDPETLC